MKYIKQPNQSTIQVTFEMTVEELKLLTQGLGCTNQDSRVKAGMTPSQSSVCCKFFHVASEACKDIEIKTND